MFGCGLGIIEQMSLLFIYYYYYFLKIVGKIRVGLQKDVTVYLQCTF
jgi:hypothetical protein